MNENVDIVDENGAETPARMRFKGIVESGVESAGAVFGIHTIDRDERRWTTMSRQVSYASLLVAIFIFFSFLIGPPLGNYLAYRQLYGSTEGWQFLSAYGTETFLFAVIIPLLVLLIGYAVSRMATMLNAAESIAAAAQQYVTPDVTAAHNVNSVGEAVRTHMVALNEGLDHALSRLANVEAMIRQHVEAIELAGDAIEQKASNSVTRVADERSRLMDLTESLNAHADSFAAAIAERARSSVETLQSADRHSAQAQTDFEDRLTLLEAAAGRAVTSFESLRDALVESTERFSESAASIDAAAERTETATKRTTAAADAAAESAARNAANLVASTTKASEASRRAADQAITSAATETERLADAAIENTAKQADRIKTETSKALEEMTDATDAALKAAISNAEKASDAIDEISRAADATTDAAHRAADKVATASEVAQAQAATAIAATDDAEAKIRARADSLAAARTALARENERLESLISEQRKRADRLADVIASQTDQLTRLAEAQLASERNEPPSREVPPTAPSRQLNEERPTRQPRENTAAPRQRGPKRSDTSRLEELARDIAERRPRRNRRERATFTENEKPSKNNQASGQTPSRSKGDVSWKEILTAAKESDPLELGAPAAKPKPAATRDAASVAIDIISELQQFTYELETRLYGDPPPALSERYERGDRNVFANRILRLNEADVKRRIRSESARDRDFENSVHEFLQGFEKLLEDATTSETADEELEEYLSSPLGRVYLLIGATVGYFA